MTGEKLGETAHSDCRVGCFIYNLHWRVANCKIHYMRYLSIDTETTGLNPDTCQIIEFAVVADDLNNQVPLDKLNCLHLYLKWDILRGEPYALALNAKTIGLMPKAVTDVWTKEGGRHTAWLRPDDFETVLNDWMRGRGYSRSDKAVVAGKNFSRFDFLFLRNLAPKVMESYIHHRTIDPAMFYFDPKDEVPPASQTCMERAGLTGQVAHTALEDALMVVELVRRGLAKQNMPSQGIGVRW